jgi:hypothetical protein
MVNREQCQGEHGISKEACNAKSGRVSPMFVSYLVAVDPLRRVLVCLFHQAQLITGRS